MNSMTNLYIGWFLYDSLCIILFLLIGFRAKIKRNHLLVAFTLISCCIAVFGNAITIDYRAYWKIIQQVVYGSQKHIHLESIYVWLINQIGASYFLWQLYIYVPAYILFYFVVRKLKIDNLILFLMTFAIISLYYECIGSRQFLFVVMFYVAIIQFGKKRYFWGIGVLILSSFFHKMALIAVPILLLSFFQIGIKKRFIVLFIVVISIISRYYLKDVINILMLIYGNSEGVSYINNIGENADSSGSIWWLIIGEYNRLIKYIITTYALYNTRYLLLDGSTVQKIIYRLVFWSVLTCLFCNIVNIPIGGRLFSLVSIGFCYLLSQVCVYNKINTTTKVAYYLAILIGFVLNNAFITGVSHSVMLGDLQLE